jgi:hypothetical protein
LKDAGYSGTGGGGGDNYSMSNASTNSGSVSASAATATVVVVGATMKRKKARMALQTETFCETRSLIQLKMGFLSMTYGVLLRWDCTRTGTITLVVLRKNCHEESFYPRQQHALLSHMSSSTTTTTTTTSSASSEQQQQHPYKRHKEFTNNSNHNIAPLPSSSSSPSSSSRQQGLKNALLDPPYYVPRPLGVDPHNSATVLQVSVLYATGLNYCCRDASNPFYSPMMPIAIDSIPNSEERCVTNCQLCRSFQPYRCWFHHRWRLNCGNTRPAAARLVLAF